jgi:hypothetical protein
VFALAQEFGDDGNKGGEFGAFPDRIDYNLFLRTRAEVGEKNKPILGAYFATEHVEPPPEVLDLYKLLTIFNFGS